jgi:SsrA-binding protein
MKPKTVERTYVCRNRKARHDYEIIDTIEAGIILKGSEIKSVRQKHVSLDGSFAVVEGGQLILVGCNIDQYKEANVFNHEPKRNRTLLLHKQQIRKFAEKAKVKGFSLIPLSVYLAKGRAKVELAVCKGKKLHDKRQTIKERDMARDQERGG